MVMPLVYAMNLNRCMATIVSRQPEFDPAKFAAATPQSQLYVITIIGAVVLVISAAMATATGLWRMRRGRSKPRQPEAEELPLDDIELPDVDA
jgi:hypothetical protein